MLIIIVSNSTVSFNNHKIYIKKLIVNNGSKSLSVFLCLFVRQQFQMPTVVDYEAFEAVMFASCQCRASLHTGLIPPVQIVQTLRH